MRRVWSHHLLSIRLVVAAIVVAAACMAVAVGYRGAQATPAPVLSVTGYPAPGNALRLQGERFIPGESATLYYDTTPFATVKIIQQMGIIGTNVGGFRVLFTVPTSTITGAHTLKAIAQPSGLTAQITMTVKANWTQYGFTSTNTRYNPYETAISVSNVSKLAVDWMYTDPNSAGLFTFNTPSVDDGSIYFSTLVDNTTFALDATTGSKMWSFTNLNFPAGTAEPAVAAGTLYTTGYYLYSIAAGSGLTNWMGNTVYTVPLAPSVSNGNVYVTSADSLLSFPAGGCGQFACSPSWTYTDPAVSINEIPAVANGWVYVEALGHLTVVDAATGKLQWTGTLPNIVGGSPVVDGTMAFIAVGNSTSTTATLYAFNAAGCGSTTCAPIWSGTLGQQYNQPPAVNLAAGDGTVFVSSSDGSLYAFAESGCASATCAPIWKGQTGGKIESAPAIANGVVYVGSDDNHIHAFNASGCGSTTCQPIWNYPFSGEVQSSPIVVNGMVYVTPRGNTLYAFALPGTATPHRGQATRGSTHP